MTDYNTTSIIQVCFISLRKIDAKYLIVPEDWIFVTRRRAADAINLGNTLTRRQPWRDRCRSFDSASWNRWDNLWDEAGLKRLIMMDEEWFRSVAAMINGAG